MIARQDAPFMGTVDQLWDALRRGCCATKPHTDAKVIVMMRRDDLERALETLSNGGEAMGAGKKIIDGLKDAVRANFRRVHIDGQTWVRIDRSSPKALTLLVEQDQRGVFVVTSAEVDGLLVASKDLGEALAGVPGALAALQDAKS